MKKYLYLLVEKDEYELPLAVFDSAEQLSAHLGLAPSTVKSCICKAKKRGNRCKYVQVEVDDDEDSAEK